jgi:hypothetical protein
MEKPMAPQHIWSKVSEKYAYILVLRGPEVQLFKVSGMSLTLKGKVKKVMEALEQGGDPGQAGGKLVETLDAKSIRKAEVSPGSDSLKLYGDGEKPRTLSFSTDGNRADEVLQVILAQSGRSFHTAQEEIGVIEALAPPAIIGLISGLLWAGLNQSANQLAAGEEVEIRGTRRGLKQLMAWLAEMLGTSGTIALGVVLLILVLGWAAARVFKRPQRTVWRPETG